MTAQSSYSALILHRKCPQAFMYRHVYALRRPEAVSAPERDFGAWWSAMRAAEALMRGRALGTLRAEPRTFRPVDRGPKFDQQTVTIEDVREAAAEWWSRQPAEHQTDWLDRLGEALPQRLDALFERWLEEWRDERRNEQPLGVEVFWKRRLPDPPDADWIDPEHEDVNLLGFIDEVYWDAARGMVVVRDDKSHKQLDSQTAADDLMDSQLQLYAWGLNPTLMEWELPPVRFVAYDRVRSIKPKTPVLTQMGALSKSVTQFDAHTYREWAKGPDGLGVPWGEEGVFYASGVKKGLPKWGRYQADPVLLAQLEGKTARSLWFQRTLKPLSRAVVRAHLQAAVDTAIAAGYTRRRALVTHEAPRNLTDRCTWCDYVGICREQMMGGPEGVFDLAQHNLVTKDGATMITVG